MAIPTAPIVAGSLIGGYYVARTSKNRKLGAAVLALRKPVQRARLQ